MFKVDNNDTRTTPLVVVNETNLRDLWERLFVSAFIWLLSAKKILHQMKSQKWKPYASNGNEYRKKL